MKNIIITIITLSIAWSAWTTPLTDAINANDSEEVSRLIAIGVEVNSDPFADDRSPLMLAAAEGYFTIVEMLLGAGADANDINSTGNTALGLAVVGGHPVTVQTLLARGAVVNHADRAGYTALMVAADKGYLPIVQILLAAGADANLFDNVGHTALLLAACRGRYMIVQELLANGADVNRVYHLGNTALIHAAIRGLYRTVQVLVAHGADRTVQNTRGQNALVWAHNLNPETVDMLQHGVTAENWGELVIPEVQAAVVRRFAPRMPLDRLATTYRAPLRVALRPELWAAALQVCRTVCLCNARHIQTKLPMIHVELLPLILSFLPFYSVLVPAEVPEQQAIVAQQPQLTQDQISTLLRLMVSYGIIAKRH